MAIAIDAVTGPAATVPSTQNFGELLRARPTGRSSPAPPVGERALEQLSQAQARLDRVLALAQSGKSFSPAELLALQAGVYRASQQLDLAGKLVEKATGGLKQVLQTQV